MYIYLMYLPIRSCTAATTLILTISFVHNTRVEAKTHQRRISYTIHTPNAKTPNTIHPVNSYRFTFRHRSLETEIFLKLRNFNINSNVIDEHRSVPVLRVSCCTWQDKNSTFFQRILFRSSRLVVLSV